jgi:hypothetical protein
LSQLTAEAGRVQLAAVPQDRREDIGVPARGGPDLHHRQVRLEAEEEQRLFRVAVDVARPIGFGPVIAGDGPIEALGHGPGLGERCGGHDQYPCNQQLAQHPEISSRHVSIAGAANGLRFLVGNCESRVYRRLAGCVHRGAASLNHHSFLRLFVIYLQHIATNPSLFTSRHVAMPRKMTLKNSKDF